MTNLRIGNVIKELRLKQGVTQEKLADYLNVSYQAVSKWENGMNLPDITLVPIIANFFGVSCDKLLSFNEDENQAEIMEILKKQEKLSFLDKHKERIEILEPAVEKYPRNYKLLLMLTYAYSMIGEKEEEYTPIIIRNCERIYEDCYDDSDTRYGAIQLLCYYYPKAGKREKITELANSLPHIYQCRDTLIHHGLEGAEQTEAIKKLTDTLFHTMMSYMAVLSGMLTESEKKDYHITCERYHEKFIQNTDEFKV